MLEIRLNGKAVINFTRHHLPFFVRCDILQECFDVFVITYCAIILLKIFNRFVVGHYVAVTTDHIHHILSRVHDYFRQLQLKLNRILIFTLKKVWLEIGTDQQLRATKGRKFDGRNSRSKCSTYANQNRKLFNCAKYEIPKYN